MALPAPPPIPLFPPAPATNLVSNAKLQNALNDVCGHLNIGGKPPNFGLTIVDLTSAANGKDFASAIWLPNTEHYAASMLKVACLYSAHTLLDLAQRFARARAPKNPEALLQMLGSELNTLIDVCCPMVRGRAPKVRLPDWRDMFTASGTGAGMSVRFTPGYAASLEGMIVPSDNAQAGRCIRGVSYAYMNGLMLRHGFFDDISQRGVWLAGDYSGSDVITIPCDNDRDTKQGTTSEAMARLGTVILLGSVLPAASHGDMTELLKKSAHGKDSSYFTRKEVGGHLGGDKVTHGKIGLGPLKSGDDVYSDLNAIANPLDHGGRFIVCYTNVDYNPYAIDHVLAVFKRVIGTYQSVASSGTAAPVTTTTAPRATATP